MRKTTTHLQPSAARQRPVGDARQRSVRRKRGPRRRGRTAEHGAQVELVVGVRDPTLSEPCDATTCDVPQWQCGGRSSGSRGAQWVVHLPRLCTAEPRTCCDAARLLAARPSFVKDAAYTSYCQRGRNLARALNFRSSGRTCLNSWLFLLLLVWFSRQTQRHRRRPGPAPRLHASTVTQPGGAADSGGGQRVAPLERARHLCSFLIRRSTRSW